jgi:hypothetical protein
MINKLWPHLVWWFSLCKDAFHELWATSSLHTIIHTFKNTLFKSHGVRVFIHFFFFFFFFLEFGHLYEGVAWFICHSISRMSKISFLNKHQITFEIKMPDQFFKTPIGKLILVKVMNWIYEIAQGFKDVFVSLYKKTLSEKWIMLGRKHDWMTNSLFHWNFGKEV